ncbi:hypothetical protein FOLKNPGA_02486 [Legionella sp. PC1000]|uniref:hypothetical protein n=1 Tax=Legionella sp. PC1000 TaxID=2746060 RepID=UPI0015FB1F09|nr:hypothetical protein [Legionella sp. PC1000]QLZ69688.1 hypothetical protein FOLKNPGA_02486 [Legionella sp. PC1000]
MYSHLFANKKETKVKQLKQIITRTRLDWSDFILLTTSLLKQLIGTQIQDKLYEIEHLYLDNRKEEAIQAILTVCQTETSISYDKALLNAICTQANHLTNDPMKLESRRYFETKFSLNIWQSLEQEEFSTLTKLSALVHDIDPTIDIPKRVNTLKEAEIVIGRMEQIWGTKEIQDQMRTIMSSGLFQRKDRGTTRIDEENDIIGSSNLGIMHSSAPNPDNAFPIVRFNRHPDVNLIKPNHKNGYSATNTHVPFVCSLSGHTGVLLLTIRRFLDKYRNDDQEVKEKDIKNLIKIFFSFTCKSGFHSYGEIFTVLRDPEVQKMALSNYIIPSKLSFQEQCLHNTYQLACDYAYQLQIKKTINHEISTTPNLPSEQSRWSSIQQNIHESHIRSKMTGHCQSTTTTVPLKNTCHSEHTEESPAKWQVLC